MSTASTVSRLTGRNLIAGRWTPASGDQFESHNPAHWDEVIGVFPNAGPKEAAFGGQSSSTIWLRLSSASKTDWPS